MKITNVKLWLLVLVAPGLLLSGSLSAGVSSSQVTVTGSGLKNRINAPNKSNAAGAGDRLANAGKNKARSTRQSKKKHHSQAVRVGFGARLRSQEVKHRE